MSGKGMTVSSTTHIDPKTLKRPDEFMRTGQAFFRSMAERRSIWVPLLSVIAGMIVAFYAYSWWKYGKDNRAWEAYYQATKAPEANRIMKYEEVARQFPSTQAGLFAMIMVADHYFDDAKKEI